MRRYLPWLIFFGICAAYFTFNYTIGSPSKHSISISDNELDKLKQKIQDTNLSDEALEKATKEYERLYYSDFISHESAEIRKYLDFLLSLPWAEPQHVSVDIKKAKEILDQDHFGLDDVKERILEYLALYQRVGNTKAPVICLAGPPGVGKTTLVKSIAKAMGRDFQKISLGGVHDESVLRGMLRVYIGSRPGKILDVLAKAKTTNTVILLDEIDKITSSPVSGDPYAALLEVLDPEQNSQFDDQYLGVSFDLSNVVFVATANDLSQMPRPLLDRLEIIAVPGYAEEEKFNIAKFHLLPKQMEQNGFKEGEITIDDDALKQIIHEYTLEAGARNLGRQIGNLCRKVAKKMSEENLSKVHVSVSNLESFLGVPKVYHSKPEAKSFIGVTNGLSWSEVGGGVLTIEAVVMAGTGQIIATGTLGDVMKESIDAASSYIRSKAKELGIDPNEFCKHDIHVHAPEGGTPKDGPSAGVAMVTSMVSVLTNRPVRHDVAMTGEITLRGRVLPIGGLKEKLLAAKRQGIKTLILPLDNKKDLSEIPQRYQEGLNIIFVDNLDQVLKQALE